MTQAEIYLAQAVTVMFFVGFTMLMLMIARDKLQRYAITHVLCEFITPHQTGFTKMLREVGGLVQLPVAVKGGIPKTFPIGTSATFTVGWPDYFPRFLKVMARKTIFMTDTWEPVSRTGKNPWLDPALKPELLTVMQNEAATSLVIKRAQEESMELGYAKQPKRGIKITFTHILLIFLLIGITVILVWGLQNMPDIMAGLGLD